MKEVKDIFSKQAATYAAFRPEYPAELYDFLLGHVQHRDMAWDAGTGNGQVAGVLSGHFESVYATDISAKQLANAVQKDNITYKEERAEHTSLADGSIDLITVAQAFHWFDFEGFYEEVRRVAKPGGVLAVWTYNLLSTGDDRIDNIINDFYFNTVGPYWDKERAYVDDGYKGINFPFEEILCSLFHIRVWWAIEQLEGYLNSWSSVQHFITKTGSNPVDMIVPAIRDKWGDDTAREVVFPVYMRIGKI